MKISRCMAKSNLIQSEKLILQENAMTSSKLRNARIIFFGVAEDLKITLNSMGKPLIDIFQLSKAMCSTIYPISTNFVWVFLVHRDDMGYLCNINAQINFISENGKNLGNARLVQAPQNITAIEKTIATDLPIEEIDDHNPWGILQFRLSGLISKLS